MKEYRELYEQSFSTLVQVACSERLYHCTAWFSRELDGIVWLRSYNTVVACYIPAERKVVRFGKYSNTTYQHMRKFRTRMWELYNLARECKPWDIEEVQCEFENWYR